MYLKKELIISEGSPNLAIQSLMLMEIRSGSPGLGAMEGASGEGDELQLGDNITPLSKYRSYILYLVYSNSTY